MTRRITAIAVAIVLAALGAAGGLFLILTADKRAQDRLHDGVFVLVAASDIQAGTSGATIRSRNLAVAKQFPKAIVDESALTNLDQSYDNLVLQTVVPNGTILLQTNFGKTARSTNDLALEPGKMAIPVQTVTPTQAASYIHVGNDVAILASFTTQQTSGVSQQQTVVLLSPVRLLAVSSVGSGLLITVGVTKVEAELLLEAKNRGTLYVGLLGDGANITPDGG
jgi:Flp pilus assembly protein CpaB